MGGGDLIRERSVTFQGMLSKPFIPHSSCHSSGMRAAVPPAHSLGLIVRMTLWTVGAVFEATLHLQAPADRAGGGNHSAAPPGSQIYRL